MKLIPMILSFVMGRLNSKHSKGLRESAMEIFDEVTFRSRSIVTLTLGGLGAVILLCGGVFIAILDATTQYDRSGIIVWTATFGAGVTLVLLAGLTFALVFMKAWPRPALVSSKEAPLATAGTSPLEAALATLVMDFVKEREVRRNVREAQEKTEARTQAHPAGRPADPPRGKREDPAAHVH